MIALILLATVADPAWTAASTPMARADVAVALHNGHLYVGDGYDTSGANGAVHFASIAADHSPGAFVATTSMPTASGSVAFAAVNNRLYAAGGNLTEVDVAPINADGSLGAFTATAPLSRGPYGQGLVAAAAVLYAVGGGHVNSSSPLNITYFTDVSVGTIAGDGSVTWAAGTPLPSARTNHGLATDGAHLFVAGGTAGAGPIDEVLVSAISGSTNGAWTLAGKLPSARLGPAAFTSNGFLFVVGGQDAALTPLDDVLQARILPDGTLGAWIKTAPVPHGRYLHGAVASDGYAYVIDGFTTGYTADVEWKQLATPGGAAKITVDNVPARGQVGDCVGPFTAQLRDSAEAPTWADQDVPLTIIASGTGVPHSNENCTAELTQPKIAAGKDSLQFWVYAQSAPILNFDVTAAGLAPGSATLDVGEKADPHTVNGWGCNSGAPAGWLALLVLLYSSRRATAGSRRDARQAG